MLDAVVYASDDEAYRGLYTIRDIVTNGTHVELMDIVFRHFDNRLIQLIKQEYRGKNVLILSLNILRELMKYNDMMPVTTVSPMF